MNMQKEAALLLADGPFGHASDIFADLCIYYSGLRGIVNSLSGNGLPITSIIPSLLGPSFERRMLDERFRSGFEGHLLENFIDSRLTGRAIEGERDLYVTDLGSHDYYVASGWDRSVVGREMISLVQRDLAPHELEYISASEEDAVRLRQGLDLLFDLCGDLGREVVRSTYGAMVVSSQTLQSGFVVPVPMVSVIEHELLDSPVEIAEALFHEACHQRLYDLIAVRDIFRPEYDFLSGPHAEIPWGPIRGVKRTMDGVRVISTLHVYTHLLVLYGALVDHGLGGRFRARTSEYVARGDFFATLVRGGFASGGLGGDGLVFGEWLVSIFDRLSAGYDPAQSAYRAAADAALSAAVVGS